MFAKRHSLFAAHPPQSPSFRVSPSPTSLSRRGGTRARTGVRKGYATVAREGKDQAASRNAPEPDHVWPEPGPGQKCPTPYQILDLKHDGKYSKALYYRLVKLYHPDLQGKGRSKSDAAYLLKMERYRLIVAAHAILSDPVKRRAYDRCGAGWDGRAEARSKDGWAQPSPYHPRGPFSPNWHGPDDPVWQNATWEDWERWRHDRDAGGGPKTAPVYMAHSRFLAVVVALAIVGSSLNGQRASEAGAYLVEQRDMAHDAAAKELRKVRQEVGGMTNRQDRIDFFIRQREAALSSSAADYQNLRDEKAERVLKDREICASDNTSGE